MSFDCSVPGCKGTTDSQGAEEKKHGVTLCDTGGPDSPHWYAFRDAPDKSLWIENNITAKLLTRCPECDTDKHIADGDYLCEECRIEKLPKWAVTFTAQTITDLKGKKLTKLLKFLVEQGIEFEAKLDS